MKILNQVVLMVIIALMFACNQEEVNSEIESSFEYHEYDFQLDGSKDQYIVKLKFNKDKDEVVDYSFSQNLYEIIKLEEEELKNHINDQINKSNSQLRTDDENDGELTEHAGCIEWCNDEYTNDDGTKKKGRGSCKAGCWVDTMVRLVGALVPGK